MVSPRVLRGGCWGNALSYLRSVSAVERPADQNRYLGFRLVREPEILRVLRGGAWFNRHGGTRSANRDGIDSTTRGSFTGFRLVRELK